MERPFPEPALQMPNPRAVCHARMEQNHRAVASEHHQEHKAPRCQQLRSHQWQTKPRRLLLADTQS